MIESTFILQFALFVSFWSMILIMDRIPKNDRKGLKLFSLQAWKENPIICSLELLFSLIALAVFIDDLILKNQIFAGSSYELIVPICIVLLVLQLQRYVVVRLK